MIPLNVNKLIAKTFRRKTRNSIGLSFAHFLLKKLHWLPVPERIKYKIILLTFKTLHFGKPSYLNELLAPYQPSRTLRSAESHLLRVPDIRSSAGRRSFSYAAPELWNAMPLSLRTCSSLSSFGRMLKTFLFPP